MSPQIDNVVETNINSTTTDAKDVAEQIADTGIEQATVIEATTVDKPKKLKKQKEVVETSEDKPVIKKAKKKTETETPKLIRPPMDIITRDFEQMITDHEISGHKLKKLGYKCGKILFGIPSDGGKDFRIIAYKARKKSHTVAGKSRCIFYFGLIEDAVKHAKEIVGATSTKFGKCAVQSKTPVQLVLDKVTYNETFTQDSDKVSSSLKKLIDLTIKQRASSWKEFQKKKTEDD